VSGLSLGRNGRRRNATFSPLDLPELTAWLSWANATDTGTLSVPDLKGGSPAIQATAARKPTLATADNGVPIGTFVDDLLALPLSAAINDNLKFGMAFWVKLANVSGLKTFCSIQTTAGGASANKLLVNTFGASFEARAQAVDRRAQVTALDTNWRFCYLGIDCSKGTEPAQVVMSLDGNHPGTVAFSSDTAWPASLGTPTGNMLIGGSTLTPASPLVGSIGDIYFFLDQLSAASVARLMQFNRPF
jgi:hypothetical protein